MMTTIMVVPAFVCVCICMFPPPFFCYLRFFVVVIVLWSDVCLSILLVGDNDGTAGFCFVVAILLWFDVCISVVDGDDCTAQCPRTGNYDVLKNLDDVKNTALDHGITCEWNYEITCFHHKYGDRL